MLCWILSPHELCVWFDCQLSYLTCVPLSSQFCSVMRSAELVSHSGWLFFSCWSSCGVSEVSSLLSVPLLSCLPNVNSANKRKSACQVDYFHIIKSAPCPSCLSIFPSQWFTHSMNRPLASLVLFILLQSFWLSLFKTQTHSCSQLFNVFTHASAWTHVKFISSFCYCSQNVPL